MNKYYSIHLLLAVMVIGVVILPIAGQAQTNVQEDPTRPSQQPGGTQQPGGAQTGGATDNERARAAEAERKRTTDERRPHRDRGEWYVGGFIGATLGHDFSDVERPGAGVGSTGDIGLSDSVVYGGKLGYFLPDRWNWLGFETEAFNTTPHLEQ